MPKYENGKRVINAGAQERAKEEGYSGGRIDKQEVTIDPTCADVRMHMAMIIAAKDGGLSFGQILTDMCTTIALLRIGGGQSARLPRID